MSFFSSIAGFFKGLFSKKTITAIDNALDAAAPYVAVALPVVVEIARLTPSRLDEEIIEAFRHFGIDRMFDLKAQRDVVLRDLGVQVIRERVKDP